MIEYVSSADKERQFISVLPILNSQMLKCVIDDHEILQTCHQSPKVPFCLAHESDRVTRRPYDLSVKAHVCAGVCHSPENRAWS